MNNKKVIFVCNYAADYGGNFLASLNNLAKKLRINGVDSVFVFPVAAKDKNWEVNLSIFKVFYIRWNPQEIGQLLDKISKNGDIIHLHFVSGIRYLFEINKIANSKRIDVVYHQHMDMDFQQHNHLKNIVKKFVNYSLFRKFFAVGVSHAV